MKPIQRILVTGAAGQIGTELVRELKTKYGADNVVASDLKLAPAPGLGDTQYCALDVVNEVAVEAAIERYRIDTVFHMAAILSATGEKHPQRAWDVNMNGTIHVLNAAVKHSLHRVIIPSSIAVWGPGTPAIAPQETVLQPTTMYGITKVCGELLADYYVRKYGIDVRGLRYPGIISAETPPGGGTTDYAVDIYYQAVKHGKYTCFVREDTRLPMMYMPDCLKATLDLAGASFATLNHHSNFNVGSMSFTAGDLAANIRKYLPHFEISYAPDERQAIADSWPDGVDDSAARDEWGWKPSYDLDAMTQHMLARLTEKHAQGLI
jgi:nucleoside-diphosphate-sugar epimerase